MICSTEIHVHDVMLSCWRPVPSDRPTMRDVLAQLKHTEPKDKPVYLDVVG